MTKEQGDDHRLVVLVPGLDDLVRLVGRPSRATRAGLGLTGADSYDCQRADDAASGHSRHLCGNDIQGSQTQAHIPREKVT